MTTIRVSLRTLDNRAFYRSHETDDHPLHEYVALSIDRDRFNALGKPGYLDVTYTPATPEEAPR